jgi:hypothetical protein
LRGVKIPYEQNHKYIDNIVHKLCSDCEKWYPITNEYFYKNKSSSDGYFPYCKNCTKNRSTKWQEDNYEQYQQGFLKRMREALKKPEKKQYNRQLARKQKESGYYKEYQLKNKDYFSEYHRNRRMNKSHEISDYEWVKCKEYFNHTCAYCGLPENEHYIIYAGEEKKTDFHKEHVDHNGSNKIDNCVPACQMCNSSKWAFSLDEWYTQDNPNFTKERLDKIHKWLDEDYKLIK